MSFIESVTIGFGGIEKICKTCKKKRMNKNKNGNCGNNICHKVINNEKLLKVISLITTQNKISKEKVFDFMKTNFNKYHDNCFEECHMNHKYLKFTDLTDVLDFCDFDIYDITYEECISEEYEEIRMGYDNYDKYNTKSWVDIWNEYREN